MACDKYDALILGGGNAGIGVTVATRKAGLSVAVVEDRELEGHIVGRNIVEGPVQNADYSSIPSCVFTAPALSSAGLTKEKARQSGRKIKVEQNDMGDWLSSRTYNESAAWAKVIVEQNSERILGAHLVGHAGEELIHLFAFAMKFGITAGDIQDTVFAFPTYSSDIKSMV